MSMPGMFMSAIDMPAMPAAQHMPIGMAVIPICDY
jgi:hypothetical protein